MYLKHDTAGENYEARTMKYRWTTVSMGNMFQELPQLWKTADNTEHYI